MNNYKITLILFGTILLMGISAQVMGQELKPTHHWKTDYKTEKDYKKDNRYCKGKVRGSKTPDVWDKEHIDFLVYKACMEEREYKLVRSKNDRNTISTAGDGDL
mgnify:FL=1